MNLRQVGAYALLANAAIGVVLTIAAITANGDTPTAIVIIQLLGFLLFIVGLPAIWLSQPQTGRQGQVGLALLGLGSAIAFIVVLLSLVGGSFPDAAPFASALAACLGSILVGWQTVQARVFPAGIGWLLLATGVLNFADGYLPASTFATIFAITLGLASVVTRIGYGWLILKRPQLAYQASVAI